MNELTGKIESIKTNGSLSLVRVDVMGILFTSIITDTPESVDYLIVGREVNVIFKETEVIIGKGTGHPISLQNKLAGKIKSIEQGVLLSKILIDTPAGNIASIITTNAIKNLGLKKDEQVTAMIKTNEVMLSEQAKS